MINEYLKDKIKNKGFAVYRLHRISGVSTTAINLILQGKTKKPDTETLKKLALAFNEPPEKWLEIAGHIDSTEKINNQIELKYNEKNPILVEFIRGYHELTSEKRIIAEIAIKALMKGLKEAE